MAVKRIVNNRLEKSNILPESPGPTNSYLDSLFKGRISEGAAPTPTQNRLPGDLWKNTTNGVWYHWTGTLWEDMRVTTSGHGFMDSTDKVKLNTVATSANNYIHPTTSGNVHIPAGGGVGDILKFLADGTAQWATESASSTILPSLSFAGAAANTVNVTLGAGTWSMLMWGSYHDGVGSAVYAYIDGTTVASLAALGDFPGTFRQTIFGGLASIPGNNNLSASFSTTGELGVSRNIMVVYWRTA